MVNQQVFEGHWNEIQGKLRDRWGQLTEDELQRFDGNVQQLVGMIQRKTGEAREKIESYIEELTNGSSLGNAVKAVKETTGKAVESVKAYAAQASETAQETATHAAEQLRAGYAEAEQFVRRRPVESLAVCFGAGLITGVVVGLVLRSR